MDASRRIEGTLRGTGIAFKRQAWIQELVVLSCERQPCFERKVEDPFKLQHVAERTVADAAPVETVPETPS